MCFTYISSTLSQTNEINIKSVKNFISQLHTHSLDLELKTSLAT